MKIFVSVGTTEFRPLTDALCSDEGYALLRDHHVVLQFGTGKPIQTPPNVVAFDFTKTLPAFVEEANLVISHAAAGTRLDVISKLKPHIMVCNDSLAGNHQMEMVTANLENKAVRVFENVGAFMKYLKETDLAKEVAEMAKHVTQHAAGTDEFKKLVADVQQRPHRSRALQLVFVGGFVVFCLSRLARLLQ